MKQNGITVEIGEKNNVVEFKKYYKNF